MNLTINGQIEKFEVETLTILELLKLKNIEKKVVVELNREIIKSQNFDFNLKHGDQLEILYFMGGG